MLATKLSPRARIHSLPKIWTHGQFTTSDSTKILATFRDFYDKLYSAPSQGNKDTISQFLKTLPIPSLSDKHKTIMEKTITEEKILEVIRNLKRGLTPGPDDLSVPYYKAFANTLAPYMATFFNAKMSRDPLSPDLNTAFINVIPKPDKNPKQVGNYRQILLINNDLKILTKILANRLASFISSYIHKDQVGFIPGRQGLDQTRRAIDIVFILQSNWTGGTKQQGLLLSLDIQKAFDSVSWPYILMLLEHWGFGHRFLGLMRVLYSCPRALIRLQGNYSPPSILLEVQDRAALYYH